MGYWTFLEITKNLSESRKENNDRSSGKTIFKKLKPSQIKMIESRKEQRLKEGVNHGKRRSHKHRL